MNDSTLRWRKSSHSSGSNDCVETASLPGVGVAIRDSKNPDGPVLRFTAREWETFTAGIKHGEHAL